MQDQASTSDYGEVRLKLPGKILVMCGLFLPSFALFGMSPVLPAIATHFSDTANAGLLTRLTLSAVGIVVAIASPLVGALSDRVGAKRVLVASLGVYTVAGCLPFFLDNLYAIIAARLIMGFAASGYGAVILVLLVKNSTGLARDRWLGFMTTVGTVAAMMYAPAVGYIGRFGWRWPFLLYAIAIPLLVMAIRGVPSDPPRTVDMPNTSGATVPKTGFTLGTPWGYIVFVLTAGAVLMGPSVFAPFRMREIGISDPAVIGNLLLASSLAGVVSSASFGWIRSKLSMPATFVLGFSIIAVGLVITATATGVAQVAVGQAFCGLGLTINSPNIFILGSISGPEAYRARTIGFAKSGIYGGPLISQLLLEPVAARSDFQAVLFLVALGCLVFVAIFGWQVMSRRSRPAQPAQ